MPLSSRDFQRAARQPLATAEFLLEHGYTLDATYLAGYTIRMHLEGVNFEGDPGQETA